MDEIITQKQCTKCGEIRNIEDFHNDKNARNGKSCQCRDCVNQYSSKWQKENRRLANIYAKRYKESHKDVQRSTEKWGLAKEKYCTKCRKTKSVTSFGKDKTRVDGKRQWCKMCRLESARAWFIANRERINKKLRDWYANHPEKNHEYYKKYIVKDGKDSLLKISRKKWKSENKEKVREISRNRRSRKKNAGGTIKANEWNAILNKYGNKCLRCGRSDVKITMDHIKPIFIGGTHTVDNVQPLCLSCNSIKNTKHIDYRPF